MSEVTRILSAIEQGDPHAAEQLLPLVYDELRTLAAQKMAQEKPGQTLQATALVHEAYLRLVMSPASPQRQQGEKPHWNSRGHFFAAAAEAMRRILVDQARRRKAAKRGGQAGREELHESVIAAAEPVEDVLALNDALEGLAHVDPVSADLVRLRFFAGLTMSEAAQALGMSVRSAHDTWAYARSWLRRKMRPA
jgi:RNA polymerase sigma factor (TIGR02999 family)